MEANIPQLSQSEKKNWNPILAIVWPVYDYKELCEKIQMDCLPGLSGSISALTILQYTNYKNEKPIGRVKYAPF